MRINKVLIKILNKNDGVGDVQCTVHIISIAAFPHCIMYNSCFFLDLIEEMMNHFFDKVALITGGSRGIG
jgi:hypothetical protein